MNDSNTNVARNCKRAIRYLFILLPALNILISCDFKSADSYLSKANILIDSGEYKEAILLLNKAIKKKPNFKEAYFNRAVCYGNLKNYDEAIKNYLSLLRIDSKNTAALFYIGNNNFEKKLYSEAIVYYNDALMTKGYSLESDTSGKPSYVINFNKDGVLGIGKFDIDDKDIFYQRGLAYYELNKYQNAYKDFYRCLKDNYYPSECHFMIAMCFFESGSKDKGCDELDKAIALGDSLSLIKKKEMCQ